ncbi:MAG: hypothetical protein Q4G70_00790 [Pseudomonadota bacterium]|nr:hypothetical protein [Pseudomonadota bacterium]
MRIPLYWAEASAPALDRSRRQVTVNRWGWSDESPTAAQAHAQLRLDEALQAYRRDPSVRARESLRGYSGADGTPICEEVLDTHGTAVLTRNAYGAHCLNTPNALFVDIDHPEPGSLRTWVDRLLGLLVFVLATLCVFALVRGKWVWAGGMVAAAVLLHAAHRFRLARRRERQEPQALARVRDFFAARPDWGGRVYRTPAGLRVLVTHRPFDPLEPDTAACFDALGADAIYRRMCERQRCFRARVSAKPWRAGVREHLPPSWSGRWPVPLKYADQRAVWVLEYDRVAKGFAACHFLEALGHPFVDQAIQTTLDWHDDLSRARGSLPMA